MKRIISTICLCVTITMAYGTVKAEELTTLELCAQHPKDDHKDNSKDSRKKRVNYSNEYSKQESDVKELYRELNNVKHNSHKYKELKKEFKEAQNILIEIRITAKRNDIKINASRWETVKIR